jgi:hypothetical protein
VCGIDWMDTPLGEFISQDVFGEDGMITAKRVFLHGDGEAQRVLRGLYSMVDDLYVRLISSEEFTRLGETGEVPVIREGVKHYESIETLALRDLPAVLDTFVVLEEEREREKLEEVERKRAERKERERIRAKERRRLKKLGEW